MRAALLLVTALTLSAAPHRFRVYPNSTLTISGIAEDPKGFLWLATADGLYRFDGLHYHRIPGCPVVSARFAAVTQDSSVWVAGVEGLARYRNGRFRLLKPGKVDGFTATPDSVVINQTAKLYRVDLDGAVTSLLHNPKKDLLAAADGRVWFTDNGGRNICRTDPKRVDLRADTKRVLQLDDPFDQAAPDAHGNVWCADETHAIPCSNAGDAPPFTRYPSRDLLRGGPLLAGARGQLWFLGEAIHGISPSVEFRISRFDLRALPTAGLEDRRGHLWVAIHGKGLVEWTPDPEWQRFFTEDFDRQPVTQIVRTDAGVLVAATHGNLHRFDPAADAWPAIGETPRRYEAILPLPDGGFLASVRTLGVVRVSGRAEILERIPHPREASSAFRKIDRDLQGRIWAGSTVGLFRLETVGGAYRLRREILPLTSSDVGGLDFGIMTDQFYAAHGEGLAILDARDQWRNLPTDRPLEAVRSFARNGDGREIWVAYRWKDGFARLRREGSVWRVTDFPPDQGYRPAATTFLRKLNLTGWLWRGTNDGVYVADGNRFAPADWLHFHPGNGFPVSRTEAYSFSADRGGAVWIAGAEGAVRVQPRDSWFEAPHEAPAPRISRIQHDGKEFLDPEAMPARFPGGHGPLRIEVGSFDTSPFRDYPFRYRLLPGSPEWQPSNDGVIAFDRLISGPHTLEVAYTGDGPSPVMVYRFQLTGAASPWSWLTVVPVSAAALAWLLRHRAPFDVVWYRISRLWFRLRRRAAADAPAARPAYRTGALAKRRYRVIRPLSSGGFSIVYETEDTAAAGARVAVKVLENPAGGNWLLERFASEVATLHGIDHPGVVPILDWWVSPDGEPCIAMPLLDGPTLRSVLQTAPPPTATTARWARQIGSALAAIHARGIVHRDLKPENIILCAHGTTREHAVLIDFGAAGLHNSPGKAAASTLLTASFDYMAPERITGHYSPASDTYAFAVVLMELLAGVRLSEFRSIASDAAFPAELTAALARSLPPETAAAVAQLLADALAPNPNLRPADVENWAGRVACEIDPA